MSGASLAETRRHPADQGPTRRRRKCLSGSGAYCLSKLTRYWRSAYGALPFRQVQPLEDAVRQVAEAGAVAAAMLRRLAR